MTQEIRQKLEQAAIQYGRAGKLVNECYPFMDGAQTILENPGEWGLAKQESVEFYKTNARDIRNTAVEYNSEIGELKSQLAKYREALERIANADDKGIEFGPLDIARLMKNCAKEALKQE